MKKYTIDRLAKDDIFSGILIAPMRQYIKSQGITDTRKYNFNDDMAIITHYLQNINTPEGVHYEAKAIPLLEKYYRATHTDLAPDAPVNNIDSEALFSAVRQAPVQNRFNQNNDFTFIDLFAGIGGFRIALEQLGGRCVYASEFDVSAQKSYGMNHGVIPFGDIKKEENKALIPDHFDVLCAGFPCQPFSLAGLRRGFADQTKGTLFYDLRTIIEEKHPQIIILENVPGLLSIHNKDAEGRDLPEKTIDTILRVLREELHYYVPDPKVLNARNFGVPQNRDRVFIVGFQERHEVDYTYPTGEGIPDIHFGDIREKNVVDTRYYMSERYWKTLVKHKEAQRGKGRGYGYRTINDKDFGHTLMVGGMGLERNLIVDKTNPDVNKVVDPRGELNHENIRILTERECARMQGFPDYFEIVAGKAPAYRQFGNSVAIPVVREVAQSLLTYAQIVFHAVE